MLRTHTRARTHAHNADTVTVIRLVMYSSVFTTVPFSFGCFFKICIPRFVKKNNTFESVADANTVSDVLHTCVRV